MKILYSLNNSFDSQIFLCRFLNYVKEHTIKIAMYGISNFFNVDFNLNYFINFLNKIDINNVKLKELFGLIKNYNPDIIITDSEPLVNFIGNESNIKVINCSYNLFSHILNHNTKDILENNIIYNNTNYIPFILSDMDFYPFSKIENKIIKKDNLNFIKPYFFIGNELIKKECHQSSFNKKDFYNFYYDEKKINTNEYFDSIASSKYCISSLSYTFIIDNFYNKKYSYFLKPKTDDEYFLSKFLEKNKIGEVITKDIIFKEKEINCLNFNKNKQLHDLIEEI